MLLSGGNVMNRMSVAERRHQLVGAALTVARARGIDAATVRAVATQAGVSLGVVHYCFEDKSELLRAVAAEVPGETAASVIDALPEQATIRDALAIAVETLWHAMRENRDMRLLSHELTVAGLRDEALAEVVQDQYAQSRVTAELFLRRIAEVTQVEWVVPLGPLCRSMIAVVDGYSLAWLVDGDDEAARAGLYGYVSYLATLTRPV